MPDRIWAVSFSSPCFYLPRLQKAESSCLWSRGFDLIAAIWNISSDAETFEQIWVDFFIAFHTLKVPGQCGKKATGTIPLRLAKYVCTRRNECEYLETSHQLSHDFKFKTPLPWLYTWFLKLCCKHKGTSQPIQNNRWPILLMRYN